MDRNFFVKTRASVRSRLGIFVCAMFRQLLYLGRATTIPRLRQVEGGEEVTAVHVKEAAEEISRALSLQYRGLDGLLRPVAGDLNKVAFVPGLSKLSLQLLQQALHLIGQVPGTTGVRTLMRYRAKSMQVAYGTAPIFVTISPGEKHNYLMLRLARWSRRDPAVEHDQVLREVGGREYPKADTGKVVSFEERRRILALKPVAAAMGFKVQIMLLLRHVFGLRMCPFCPACQRQTNCKVFCADLMGNASELEGGAFGRAAAAFFSIESQKSSALHVHGHVVIEGLHQYNILQELETKFVERGEELVRHYLDFKAHVCKQVHARPEEWTEAWRHRKMLVVNIICWVGGVKVPGFWGRGLCSCSRKQKERRWKRSGQNTVRGMACVLCQLTAAKMWSGTRSPRRISCWKQTCGRKHMRRICKRYKARGSTTSTPLIRRQEKGGRWRAAGGVTAVMNVGKAFFPFEKQTSEEAMVVCAGVAETFSLPVTGRRNALGSLFGPRSCGWLNGSHPALLIGGRGNSDVQLAMRMPITAASHWKNCSQECVGQADLAALQRVMQAAQAAQIGYSTDYLTKRQAKGLYECREFARGHAALSGKLVEEGASVGQVTRRHAQRLVADCFVRGVARGAVETENLNMETTRTRHDPCAAECIQTFSCVTFPGAALLEIVERAVAGEAPRARAGLVQVGEDGEPRLRDMAMLYALRGGDAAVAYLSPYEWVRYWAVVPRAKAEVAVAEGRRALAFPPNSFCSELSQTFG